MTRIDEVTYNFNESVNEIMELMRSKIDWSVIETMSSDDFELMKAALKLVDVSTELTVTYGRTLLSIENQLDLILASMETKEIES